MSVTVKSHWDGDRPAILWRFPGGAWHGSPNGLATVVYDRPPLGIDGYVDDGVYVEGGVRKVLAAREVRQRSRLPCVHLGEVVKKRGACQGGDVHRCAIYGTCARQKCSEHKSCFDGVALCEHHTPRGGAE